MPADGTLGDDTVANEEGPVIAENLADVLSRFVDRRQGLITINDVLADIAGRQGERQSPLEAIE